MYSTTIKSDGVLHPARTEPLPPEPAPRPAPPAKKSILPPGLSGDRLLIIAIAFLLLQNKKPDWLLLTALAYLLL